MKLGSWEIKLSERYALWTHSSGDEVMATKDNITLSTIRLHNDKLIIKTFDGCVTVNEHAHEIYIYSDSDMKKGIESLLD